MRLLSRTLLLGIIVFASQADAAFFGFGSSMENVSAKDGKVTIGVSKLGKIQSRHYRYQESGKVIKFFIVRDGQGTVRAALDACEQCWRAGKGYKLTDNGFMLCVHCGMKFPLSRIGLVKGGCNPHPFPFWMDNNAVVIEAQELMLGIGYFPENLQ